MGMIENICKSLTNVIEKSRSPIATIPSILLICSAIKRPGLSSMAITSRIIQRQAEAGAPVGPAADGSANIAEAMERIRVEELVKALKLESRVQVAIPVGGIQVAGTGMGPTGPITFYGTNVNIASANGIIG